MPDAAQRLEWPSLREAFSIIAAADVLRLTRMERHQDLQGTARWLDASVEPPLVLLFISHRWETLAHPDPSGRQLAAVQALLERICTCIEAMLAPRDERLRLVASLDREGDLQAAEIARRMFGFGPFAGSTAGAAVRITKAAIQAEYARCGKDRARFRDWLASRIGVWIDYVCMPQAPFSGEEVLDFKRALRELDTLVASATVVALREADDDYATRGWCATEFFIGSARSFAKGLFVDLGRLRSGQPVSISDPPLATELKSDAARIMQDTYGSGLAAWREALHWWASMDGPLADQTPPDAWARYRDLQGGAFTAADADPNPFRRVMETVRAVETLLVAEWLMADQPRTVDLGDAVFRMLGEQALRCAKSEDLLYVGLLAACNGWVDGFRPLLRDCLRRHVVAMNPSVGAASRSGRTLVVDLVPPPDSLRSLLLGARPNTPGAWASRLRYENPVGSVEERAAVAQVRARLEQHPLRYAFVESA
jgi:hypothetical protein